MSDTPQTQKVILPSNLEFFIHALNHNAKAVQEMFNAYTFHSTERQLEAIAQALQNIKTDIDTALGG